MTPVKFVLALTPGQAAALKRFAEKVTPEQAMAVLYPHVSPDIRDSQVSEIIRAFAVLDRALTDARVSTSPWMSTGNVQP